jgi:hypothetical protein
MEGLSHRWTRTVEDHDTAPPRVHSAIPHPRPQRLPPHPPLRLVRQHQKDALELAAIFAKDGVDGLTNHKKDGCELLEDIGASNRDPAKLAKASAKVHPKTAKAPVYELTGKIEFVDEEEDVTVYVLLLKPAK